MEDDLGLTVEERRKLPYLLLLQPDGQRGAVYDTRHQLLADDASPALLAWAATRCTLKAAWQDALDAHNPLPRPTWAPAGTLAGWSLVWVRDDSTPDDVLQHMPRH